jgi:hypothetical protein
MYFPDLSPYQYVPLVLPEENRVNIGWLDSEHPFFASEPSLDLLKALIKLVQHPVRIVPGLHTCPFCRNAAGTGEIDVAGSDVIYAAPTLIVHYVEAHRYRPPDEFVLAATRQAEALG